jgi:hypothetical protein
VNFLNSNPHQPSVDEAEELSHAPSGGRVKMWLMGAGVAFVPLFYGVKGLDAGTTLFFGSRGSQLDLQGEAATAMSIAYLAVGAFLHFHFFWGLHPRLLRWSPWLKLVAVTVFLGAFGCAMFKVLA